LSDQPRSIPLSESQRTTLAHLASLIMLLLEHRINSPANVIGRMEKTLTKSTKQNFRMQ